MYEECSFRASLFISDIPDELLNVGQVALIWEAIVDTPKLTSLPPHILPMADIDDIKINFMALQATFKTDMKDALNKRGVSDNEFHTYSILEAIKQSKTRILSSVQYPALPPSEVDNS